MTGEAGIGKSHLVRHLADEAGAQGTTVVEAHCVASGGEPLRHAALVQLARSALPGRGRPPPLADATADVTADVLLDRVLTVMDAAGERGTALVVVEDVHWADRATCAALMVLARHIRALPVLLVLSHRDDELVRGHHVWGFLTELERAQLVLPVRLGRLGAADVARLIGRLAGPTPPGWAARVFHRSGGNPLLVEELCAAEVAPPGGTAPGEAAAGPAEVPPRIRELLLARVDRLSPVALGLARAVAATPGPVDEALLGVVVGDDAAPGLDEATDHHLLVREAGRVRFRHALVAEAVHGQAPVAERSAVHARWAAALAVRGGDAALLAHHRNEAGDLEGALAASVAAADAAAGALSVRDAATHYRRALALWPLVPRPAAVAGRSHPDLCSQAAAAADGAGDAAAVAYAAEARAEAERRADTLATSLLLEREAWYLTRVGDDDTAGRRYRAAVDLLPGDVPPSVRARVLAGSVRAWERAGDHDTAIAVGRRAVVAADEHGGDLERGQAHHVLARALLRAGHEDAALAELGVAVPAAERARDAVLLTGALADQLDVLAARGRLDEAVAGGEAAAGRLRATGAREPHALLVSGVVAHARHRAGAAGPARHAAWSLLADARTPVTLAVGHLLVGLGATDAGSLRDAGEHLEMARFLAAPRLDGRIGGSIALGRAELALVEGRLGDARAAVDEGLAPVGCTGDDEIRGLLCLQGLRVAAARTRTPSLDGRRATDRAKARDAAAIERYERGLAEVTATPPAGERPALAAIAAGGRAERSRLDGDAVPDAWAEAVGRWSAVGRPREAALAAIRWAEALQGSPGGRDAAGRALDDALARAGAIGSDLLAAYVRRVARRAGIPLGSAGATGAPAAGGGAWAERVGTGPAPLTRREVEVLELVADGASNRQIGALLYISTKTASVHVSRILAKLGAATRTEAADVAHRLGLTPHR